MSGHIAHDHQHDGIDRKGFLRCMAWAGTGVVLGVVGDRVVTTALADAVQGQAAAPAAAFSFVQISDSHIGFHKAANKNVTGTFEEAVRRINALPQRPAFIKQDLARLHADTPLVLFSHVPLLAVYPTWGWATEDSTQVLALVKRFSRVTALNGHIHQIISKTEGNIVMHTAASTAYPLHPPGQVAPTPLVL